MLNRTCTALMIGLLLAPAPLLAQFRDAQPKPRVTIAPLIGYRIPYEAVGEMSLYFRDGATSYLHSREKRGGGMVAGAEAELRLFGPFGISAAALHAESAENRVEQRIEMYDEDGFVEVIWSGPTRGPSTRFYRAGLVIFLPEPKPDLQRLPVSASITIGPALVREIQPADPVPPDFPQAAAIQWDPVNHYGLHVGAHAYVPLCSPRIALRVGAEDHITFWNEQELNRQTAERFGGVADWSYGRYHLATLHAGIVLRF
jgi:hypothetical protein